MHNPDNVAVNMSKPQLNPLHYSTFYRTAAWRGDNRVGFVVNYQRIYPQSSPTQSHRDIPICTTTQPLKRLSNSEPHSMISLTNQLQPRQVVFNTVAGIILTVLNHICPLPITTFPVFACVLHQNLQACYSHHGCRTFGCIPPLCVLIFDIQHTANTTTTQRLIITVCFTPFFSKLEQLKMFFSPR